MQTPTQLLEEIIVGVGKYLINPDVEKIRQAYAFASEVHEGQFRFSGESYMMHPLEATKILLTIRPDLDTICACIMHDTVEDDRTQRGQELLKIITKKFGKDVASIVDGVSKLGRVRYSGRQREVESLRKMFVAMAKDLRVILVRLADRMHNMRTLKYVRSEKQERIARETLEIYVSVAIRLGVYEFKQEMEDLCFQILYPRDYEAISSELAMEQGNTDKQIKTGINKISNLLKKNNINGEVSGRTKNYYSIFKKMKKKGLQKASQVNDLFALRIIVNTLEECYAVLGMVHTSWTPVPDRFKDYIAKPKINGYQSLHTEVIGLLDKPTEIQIRTHAMHNTAERGVAAHWHYKESRGSIPLKGEHKSWLGGILERHKKQKESEDFLQDIHLDFFDDEIFVFTPQGQVKVLPEGSTPVDFAYLIHTEVGHSTKSAKVDGHIVPLDYKLKNGETVEIITRKTIAPSEYWLQFVKTNSAREKIKTWLTSQNHEEYIRHGQEMLNSMLEKSGHEELDSHNTILRKIDGRRLSVAERLDLLERVGNGSISPVSVLRKIYPDLHLKVETAEYTGKTTPKSGEVQASRKVVVGGEEGLEVKFASCCDPRPFKPIFGYATRGGSITIHRRDCSLRNSLNRAQMLPAHWQDDTHFARVYRAEIAVDYNPSVLGEVLNGFYQMGVEVSGVQSHYEEESKILWVDFVIYNDDELDQVRHMLEEILEVQNVKITGMGEKMF